MKKVVKFGGSSLADAAQFKKVKKIICADPSRRFVVPSAPGKRSSADEKVTDLFYQYYDTTAAGGDGLMLRARIQTRYREIIAGLGLKFSLEGEFEQIDRNFKRGFGRDYAASRGEYLNGLIMAEYLGFPFVDAAEAVRFDEAGNFLPEETNAALRKRLRHMDHAVIPGFYGSMPDGTIRTFSRGGSDITGSLVARAIRADLYENWTDVSGFLLADPRIVDNPLPIGTITYRELHDLSAMGASVLHEDAVFPVKKEGIPINIKNTNRPQDPGTMIVSRTAQMPVCGITGIAGKKSGSLGSDLALVAVGGRASCPSPSLAGNVVSALEQAHIDVMTIDQNIESVTMIVGVRNRDFEPAVRAIYNRFIRNSVSAPC